MKLDYLQFLELEVFTRFGSRLEASVEAKIRRGRLLRELLKQDRLSPLTAEQHMAWLVAYTEGHFDGLEGGAVQTRLARLLQKAAADGPGVGIASGREAWRVAVAGWSRELDEALR
jgi:F-type H+-transporting ATPase subunit alpha